MSGPRSSFWSALMERRPAEHVAIGMGSNLGDPLANLRFGVQALRRLLAGVHASPVYETVPVHVVDQPSFLNACCVGRTSLTPRRLLSELQRIERSAGRARRGRRYGPRILDLDLLLYGDRVIREPDLIVPHPRLNGRAFVLIPLRDIAADWRVPGGEESPLRSVRELARAVDVEGITRTNLRLGNE